MLVLTIFMGFGAWWKGPWLDEQAYWLLHVDTISNAKEPRHTFEECRDCPTMVTIPIPTGEFTMGSLVKTEEIDQPPHQVRVARPFAVSKYEITFSQWEACVAHNAHRDCSPKPRNGAADLPVVNVSWDDAKRYVEWLSRITGQDYRLLTEAEWEYSARSGNDDYYSFGGDDEQLPKYAWFAVNSAQVGEVTKHAHPVGTRKPNDYDLNDMYGNVAEWVEDCFHKNYEGAPTEASIAWTSPDCVRHVVRGGSFLSQTKQQLRSSSRDWRKNEGVNDVGIRVARQLPNLNR
jgi:formylglycine-generating enzyme required for sulfatase activity